MRERWEKAGLDDLLGGMSRLEFTLRFTLSNPDLDTTIVGTRDAGHLRDDIAAALKGPPPEDILREASSALMGLALVPVPNSLMGTSSIALATRWR
jgi:hypothetical protein